MLFLWSITSLLLIINSCTAQLLCIDSCTFDHEFDANFTLPSNCTTIQQEQCTAILTFDYSTRIVKVQFGEPSLRKQRANAIYTSEAISNTIITLDDESSTQNIVEYFCSTGDRCDYDYVLNQALSVYIHKTCHRLRVKLISLLHSNPSSSSRSCIMSNGNVSECVYPCELFYINPDQILRSCDGSKNLEFQTTIGRTTPTNKPEYKYRLYKYACTTELCNGNAKQAAIEKLIQSDDDECLVPLENINQTTTSITTDQSTTTTSITTDLSTTNMNITTFQSTTTTSSNQAMFYSQSFLLVLICVVTMKLFFF